MSHPYEQICNELNILPISQRLEKLTINFCTPLLNSNRFREWLPSTRNNSLRNANHLTAIKCRTNRYRDSCIPNWTRLLNVQLWSSSIPFLCAKLVSMLLVCFFKILILLSLIVWILMLAFYPELVPLILSIFVSRILFGYVLVDCLFWLFVILANYLLYVLTV